MQRTAFVAAALTLLLGCEQNEQKPAASGETKAAASAPATVSAPEPPPEAKPTGPRYEDGKLVDLPKAKSDAPADADWQAAAELEDIPGNKPPTGCPVKLVREWVQVTCRPFGGTDPTKPKWKAVKVDIVDGKGPDVKGDVKDGLATLTFPAREGGKLDAVVEYSEGGPKKVVSLSWDAGADAPSFKLRTGM